MALHFWQIIIAFLSKSPKYKIPLHFLNLYSNKLNDCSIFKIIEKFSNLKELYVGNNDLKIFDENDKYNLPNIQEIGLSDGTFEKVPIETLSKFTFKNLKIRLKSGVQGLTKKYKLFQSTLMIFKHHKDYFCFLTVR